MSNENRIRKGEQVIIAALLSLACFAAGMYLVRSGLDTSQPIHVTFGILLIFLFPLAGYSFYYEGDLNFRTGALYVALAALSVFKPFIMLIVFGVLLACYLIAMLFKRVMGIKGE